MARSKTAKEISDDRAAAKAAARPGILIGSGYAKRSMTGGRVTESQRLAVQRRARSALKRLGHA